MKYVFALRYLVGPIGAEEVFNGLYVSRSYVRTFVSVWGTRLVPASCNVMQTYVPMSLTPQWRRLKIRPPELGSHGVDIAASPCAQEYRAPRQSLPTEMYRKRVLFFVVLCSYRSPAHKFGSQPGAALVPTYVPWCGICCQTLYVRRRTLHTSKPPRSPYTANVRVR